MAEVKKKKETKVKEVKAEVKEAKVEAKEECKLTKAVCEFEKTLNALRFDAMCKESLLKRFEAIKKEL